MVLHGPGVPVDQQVFPIIAEIAGPGSGHAVRTLNVSAGGQHTRARVPLVPVQDVFRVRLCPESGYVGLIDGISPLEKELVGGHYFGVAVSVAVHMERLRHAADRLDQTDGHTVLPDAHVIGAHDPVLGLIGDGVHRALMAEEALGEASAAAKANVGFPIHRQSQETPVNQMLQALIHHREMLHILLRGGEQADIKGFL